MLWLLLGCLDHTPIPGEQGESFVAMQTDFADFRAWPSQVVAEADTGHISGQRVVYASALPEPGGAQFPTGTLLVKTIDWEGGTDVHAMVRRGGAFNADGAVGWEWFELVLADDGSPVIKWRGAEPPDGEQYQSLPGTTDTVDTVTGDCNTCHAVASDNDFVHSLSLQEGAWTP